MKKTEISNIIISALFCVLIFGFGAVSIVKCGFTYNKDLSVKDNIAVFESGFRENFFRRADIVNIHGATQKLMGNDMVEDVQYGAMVRNKWGQITSTPEKSDLKRLESFVEDISDYAKENDAEALYIQTPFKILKDNEQLPMGISSAVNENADTLLKNLENYGVDTFDLRPVLAQSPIPAEEQFFKTDHHWTENSAFYSYRKILEKLHEDYDYLSEEELEFLTDENNYVKCTLKNAFLGSWGRRTGEIYSGLDDFDYYVPKFQTNYNMTNRAPGAEEVKRTGDFYQLVMTPSFVENNDYEAKTGRYSVYLNGYTSEVITENTEIENDKKVLIFHDSFGFPVSAFLTLSTKDVTIIDVRAFEKNVMEYIKEYAPDCILFIFNPDEADFVGMGKGA